jgi:pilus assembly protein CpaF
VPAERAAHLELAAVAPPADDSVAAVANRVCERIDTDRGLPTDEPTLRAVLEELTRDVAPLAGPTLTARVVDAVVAELRGLGPLQTLADDPTVTEIMVNGGGSVWVERRGRLERAPLLLDEATVLHLIERIVGPLGLRVDRSSPVVDARLPDGSRVHAVVRPLAVDGPCLTIRRFALVAHGLADFCGPEVVGLLRRAVVDRRNIVVSGGTGSGKTTLLNALASAIPGDERVVSIEDAAELRLPLEHVVRLEARPPNAEGAGESRIRDLVRSALRMRPDRIVVGEVRGGEALDMLQAMNTGHEGSLSTCHANSPRDALRRLETMVLMSDVALPLAAVREQLVAAVDLVVQVARRGDGARRVVAVHEIGPDLDAHELPMTEVVADEQGPVGSLVRPSRRGAAPTGTRS